MHNSTADSDEQPLSLEMRKEDLIPMRISGSFFVRNYRAVSCVQSGYIPNFVKGFGIYRCWQ
jgi:hypothetical protein